ncbi:MAG TPA: hypothetical protein VJL59_16445 [Anaerolineales bacterium]|nr:hypothetical protein [Anaerolineales bacterium]
MAQCPWCEQESIFNRATDLKDLSPIAFRTVSCLNPGCGKPFNINGDSVNSAHEMLVFDCYELLQLKHYMNCILTLAQAYEVFFSLFLRVELLYKPFARDIRKDINHLNWLAEQFSEKVKGHTFAPMRALFLRQFIAGPRPANLAEAEAAIAGLKDHPSDPKDAEIEALGDKQLVALLKGVKSTTINTLRNRVVHKQAYRPTWEEAEAVLDEACSLLFPLTSRLDLHDDINWYMRRS